MKINNIGEFLHFVRNTGLIRLSDETQSFVNCMEEYDRLCNCDSDSVKMAKINQCKSLYTIFVSKSSQYKAELLSKVSDGHITFSSDGQLITTLRR